MIKRFSWFAHAPQKKAGTAKARQFQLDIGARRDPYSYDVNG